ncbi:MAG: diguanylate cyclase [Gammaproteobacteria bacterium]|jgi:diguanylate cyclase (GGDEF)-like protein|nr:diguanylate cyclase [Gammaproteobacteria bacterium]
MTQPTNILIVDDDPIALIILQNALEGMGECHIAHNGAEALAMVARNPMDLILLDALMPGMDGYATCCLLQRDFPEIPVIFVTAKTDDTSEVRALKAGAMDFINKPINPPIVRARVATHLRLKAQNDLLRSLSSHDPLTGISNRRAFEEHLAAEWRRSMRHGQPLSVLMIDIDHFKAYNDHYGHLRGDDCLCKVAQCIASSLTRGEDLVARYGGEEFVALLAGSSLGVAAGLADKIRANLRALTLPQAPTIARPYVTLSIGVAMSLPAKRPQVHLTSVIGQMRSPLGLNLSEAQDLLNRADQALYAAKAAGRDCVRLGSLKAEPRLIAAA